MPTIAIDARKYFDFGIGSYIQNLVSSLSGLGSRHRFILYCSPSEIDSLSLPAGWTKKESRFRKYSAGELVLYGREIRSAGVDLFHEPHYTLPFGLKGKSVVTIHDVIHLKLPQYFSALQRAYAAVVLRQALRQAGAVIAVSRRTKDDLIERFGIPEDSVKVVHNGVKPIFQPITDRGRVAEFRSKRSLNRPYVMYVGNVKPHKNIPTLLRAFAMARRQEASLELVFAGGSCLRDAKLRSLADELKVAASVRDLGQLSDAELLCAYNGAEMVIVPSFYEGFGFPALEAMASGVPVIVSNGGSLPEIVGDAAIICDPNRPEAFSEAITSLLNDSEKRANLVLRGKGQVRRFSWEQSAAETLSVYETVLERCRKS